MTDLCKRPRSRFRSKPDQGLASEYIQRNDRTKRLQRFNNGEDALKHGLNLHRHLEPTGINRIALHVVVKDPMDFSDDFNQRGVGQAAFGGHDKWRCVGFPDGWFYGSTTRRYYIIRAVLPAMFICGSSPPLSLQYLIANLSNEFVLFSSHRVA
ncbi:hypothetical protein AZ34_00445 [Hylemonella gracilis str. Niagara R]|uniref:Uncharacterized protein n=1 Tax=Hylemonella gracilis str. Niagara R TaxID=1458275 RepID=A0A016XKW7_9BURK|nr:hypothetical protein AZ34_00445 [Hylemonella gracilis str. Niagara R]